MELLIGIVIIAILVAITVVVYIGVTNNANRASVISDLDSDAKLLRMYDVDYDSYPTSLDSNNCPVAPTVDKNYCLKLSGGNTLVSYTSLVSSDFHLTIRNGNIEYSINSTTNPAVTTTDTGSSIGSACPSGFIPVPGSGAYSTNDFCVMKYEAKQYSFTQPYSVAAGTPWANIDQTDAETYSKNAVDQSGKSISNAHLITEAEWMTIAQNVLTQAKNWSNNTIGGSNYIYSGHNDSAPNSALAASTDDTAGYTGETNQNGNQRRTLYLSNGEVIWDLAGNVDEWTQGQTTDNQPGLSSDTGFSWREWRAVSQGGFPSASTPSSLNISNISAWTGFNGIGLLSSNYNSTYIVGFLRGGRFDRGSLAGVLSLSLNYSPSYTYAAMGFRVASSAQ